MYAHRGGAALRPENTLEAFDHGMALGADGLELDVHLSRDGVVVVHHDRTLDRTTGTRGPIAGLTAAELERVDAGYWFRSPDGGDAYPFRGGGLGIPTLRTVLLSVATPLALYWVFERLFVVSLPHGALFAMFGL